MEYSEAECAEYLSAALDAIEKNLRFFVRIPESAIPAVCAWVAHTYLIDENGFPGTVTPRLGFTSRKRGGGKSTALNAVCRLVRNGKKTMLPSKAGWMNAIEREHATICLDEADKTFPKETSRVDIQAALNAGYEPDGGTILHGNREVPTHAFVGFSGIGPVLECNTGLEPLWHRTIKVEMIPVEGVEYPEYDIEEHGRDIAQIKRVIGSSMALATEIYGIGLKSIKPEMLPGMDGRRTQIWRVLRRIGIAAGPKWQERIDQSCVDMESGRSGEPPIRSQQARIMDDVRTVTYGESVISTDELVSRLRELPDSPWSFLWPRGSREGEIGVSPGVARQLAELLEPHGLMPVPVRVPLPSGHGATRERGYRLTDHRNCGVCTDESRPVRMMPSTERMPMNGTDAVCMGCEDGCADCAEPFNVMGALSEEATVELSSLAVSMAVQPVMHRAPAPLPLFTPPSM